MSPEIEGGWVRANGVRLHVVRTGGAKPPIVLAHGFADSARCWTSLVRRLAPRFDVIAYDARGHGRSDAPASRYDLAERTADLLGLIAALDLERPLLMGHSMGGQTVARAALALPGRARGLILEDVGLSPRRAPPVRRARAEFPEWLAKLRAQSRDELIELCRSSHPRWPDEDRAPWAESKLQLHDHAARLFEHPPSEPLSEALQRLDCPLLLLRADVADASVRQRRQAVARRLARTTLVHVPGTGHNVRRDDLPATLDALDRFFGELGLSTQICDDSD